MSTIPLANLKVCARIRPLEYSSDMLSINNDNHTLTIKDITNKSRIPEQAFEFNEIYDSKTSQNTIFNYFNDNILTNILHGGNSTIISYGQTGSGKSYTTFGENEQYTLESINFYFDNKRDKRGLIPLTCEHIFDLNKKITNNQQYELSCSFVEIYLDQVRDLGKLYNFEKSTQSDFYLLWKKF